MKCFRLRCEFWRVLRSITPASPLLSLTRSTLLAGADPQTLALTGLLGFVFRLTLK